jgi:hypothetical protein
MSEQKKNLFLVAHRLIFPSFKGTVSPDVRSSCRAYKTISVLSVGPLNMVSLKKLFCSS